MISGLLKSTVKFWFLAAMCITFGLQAQTTVFSSDFSTSAGTSYSTANGLIGSNTVWSLLRSGTDYGARINSGILTLTDDATGSINASGWSLAYANAANFISPYSTILNSNPGVVTWTFNMRQIRSNPSGPASGYYGNAFVLAGTSNTTATTGTGYAVVLGNNGKIDPLRLVRYTAGIRTSTPILSSNTSGLTDWGNQYMSVKVTFTPSTGMWEMFLRNDNGIFADPSTGSLTSQGTAPQTTSTATALPLIGAFWNAATKGNQTAYFDNVKVSVATPLINSLSPPSKVAGSPAFILTVNGSNFVNGSIIRWNGLNRSTNYVSPTQLTASIPATDIAAAGSAQITVATAAAISNAQTFTIDAANVPSISTSTNSLNAFTTITGTASASQNFSSSGANLTGNITVTAPANFEVSLNNSTFFPSVSITAAVTPVYIRVKATAPAGLYTDVIVLLSNGAANKQVAISATVLSTEPTTADSAVSFSGTNSISTTITWSNGNGAKHLVIVREAAAVNALPVDGTSYSASANFGSGSAIGAGNYVVYNSTGNSVTVTGLSPTTAYYVSVIGFNGATAGTENYRTSGATANVTTPNAPLGWQITAANTEFKITFDSSVEGINNGAYDGAAFGPAPEVGELNSNGITMSAYTTGATTFGLEAVEDSPEFGNGISDGGVTDGGVYAFEVSPGNRTFGFQPSTDGYGTGSTTIRMQNQTGVNITSLNVGYTTYIYNDEAGIQSYNFSHSANNSTYTSTTVFNMQSTVGAEAAPGWKAHARVITLTGLTIVPGSYYYIRFNNQNVSGTAFDEMALDDISVVANPTSQYVSFKGNIETFVVAGNAKLSADATVNNTLAFLNGKVIIGSNTFGINGAVSNNSFPGGLSGGASSSLIVGGTLSKELSFDQTIVGTTNLFNNVTIATTAANTTAIGNNVVINGALTVDEGQTLNLDTTTLTGTLATIANNGTIATQNTTTTPVSSNKVWGGTGTFNLNAASASQTLVAGTYNNVTVTTTGGAIATGNVTVNGVLHLPNANPSSTLGSLSTGTNTLLMGANAVNTGTGDVSGIISRNVITANTLYTMGHPQTAILFPPVGTLPSAMSIRTTLGVAPSSKPNAVLRKYDFIQTGGGGADAAATKAIIKSHYLDSELNGNLENELVDWVVILPSTLVEQSRTNYSTTENFVELGNVNVGFFSPTFGGKELTMSKSLNPMSVWNGSESSSWTTAANWTPNTAAPSFATKVIIPDASTTPHDPIINDTTTIGTLTIEAGGIVNTPAASQLNIQGSTGAWINYGTFNAGTGTVTFNTTAVGGVVSDATIAGTTAFNNLTIASASTLRSVTDAYLKIGGVFTKAGSFITGSVQSTVEYTGTNQTIVVPNGAGSAYHNLIFSGTGSALPSALSINGNLITNAVVNFAGTTVTMAGTDEEAEIIGGTVNPVLNNLVINKSIGHVDLATGVTVSGTLTLSAGRLRLGANNLTLGTAAVAGSFSAANMIVADGAGVVKRPYTGTGSYFFPIGEETSNATYSPITVNVTSGTFNNAFVGVNVVDAVHPDNHSTSAYMTRYWNVTQTGISNAVATITGQYTIGDAVGGEANLAGAQLKGAFNVVSNPWIKYTTIGGNTLTATGATLTSGQTSTFTGITAETLTVTIIGEGTFCQNDVVTLTSEVNAGDPPFTYQWSGGLGSASSATPPTSASGTVSYTLTVRDANGIASTDTANVVVAEPANGGTLTGNQSICEGTAAPITLTGYSGIIIRWERSANTLFTTPTFLASTNATLTTQEIGNLNATRYLRAVVQSGSCQEVYSNYITIAVTSTTWNGTAWSSGAPTATTAAIFTGAYTATGAIEACSIQVTNNAAVVIPSGFDVTLNGRITVTSGSFTLENDAHLVQLSDVENVGNIIVERTSSSLYRLDYTLWSSPVAGQNLFDFSPETNSTRFYEYGMSQGGVEAYLAVDPLNTSFVAGKGYLIRMPNNMPTTDPNQPGYVAGTTHLPYEGVFTGVPNNGNITIALNDQGNRYSAVGNPYPSPINIHAFYEANETVMDPTSALYFWRKKNDAAASSYATITLDSYAFNQNAGGGEEYFDFFTAAEPEEWVINSGQGFFVKGKPGVVNPELTFSNSMRADAHANPFFRMSEQTDAQRSRLWINIAGPTGGFSQAAVVYSNTATLGLDYGRDGKCIGQNDIVLYSLVDSTKLTVQARPAFESNDVVPMGYAAEVAGTYTVSLYHFDGLFETGQDIYLKDNLTGVIHDLKAGDYQFVVEAGTDETRFEVVYTTSQLGTESPAITANDVIVYKQDKAIHIASGSVVMNEINVFDVRGRLIYTAKDVNASSFVIDRLQSENQMLIVNIATESGKVSKKILY